MHINWLGYNHCHDEFFSIYRPHGSGDWLFLLIKTAGIFEFGGKSVVTEPNSFILFSEGTPQLYRTYGAEYINDYIHFDASKADEIFLSELEIPKNTPVKIDKIDDLSQIIGDMSNEYYSDNPHRDDTLLLYFRLLFVKLSDRLKPQASGAKGSYSDHIHMLRTKIYNAPYEDWTVAGLANEMSMSVSYFQHLYKNTLGVNIKSDIITARVEHSKYLLATTDMSINRIVEMSGYRCGPHFMRQFKERTGLTPSEYRRIKSNESHQKDEK